MADLCKLHSPASARPRRCNTTQVEYPDDTRATEESDGRKRKRRRKNDGKAEGEKETESE